MTERVTVESRGFHRAGGAVHPQIDPPLRDQHSEASVTSFALIVKHQTLPGKRDEVRAVWEKHMAPAIADNPGHTAYFYCFDNSDPDSISAFQEYANAEASEEFLQTASYAAYLRDVEPLLAGPPQVTALTPVWIKEV
jgi:quinol monooxygenase YgiN